jgi:hypothetical protein
MNRIVTACLVVAFAILIPAGTFGVALAPDLSESKLVSPALRDALEHQESVGARIYLLAQRPSGNASKVRALSDGAPVNSVIAELAQLLLPGKLALHHQDFLDVLEGTVDARVVQALLRNPHVVRVDLNPDPPEPAEPVFGAKTLCVPTATRACVQGGRFSIQVFVFSTNSFAQVLTSSSESAVFWFFSNTNWEVVAKVLNGCAVNNNYWVYAAGATTLDYQVNFFDFVKGRSNGYGGFCPLADTGQILGFPC